MDFTKENEDDDGEEAGGEDERFFIEGSSCSESEEKTKFSHQKQHSSCKQATERSRGSSPPLLLAFSVTTGRLLQDSSPSSDLQEEEDSDQHIEDWMILGGGEQEGDSSIQLNLSYWSSISGDDSGDEDQNIKSVEDTWAVSEKDKCFADQSLLSRYFVRGRSLMCHICNRTGHQAKAATSTRNVPPVSFVGSRATSRGTVRAAPAPAVDCPHMASGPVKIPQHGTNTASAVG